MAILFNHILYMYIHVHTYMCIHTCTYIRPHFTPTHPAGRGESKFYTAPGRCKYGGGTWVFATINRTPFGPNGYFSRTFCPKPPSLISKRGVYLLAPSFSDLEGAHLLGHFLPFPIVHLLEPSFGGLGGAHLFGHCPHQGHCLLIREGVLIRAL